MLQQIDMELQGPNGHLRDPLRITCHLESDQLTLLPVVRAGFLITASMRPCKCIGV